MKSRLTAYLFATLVLLCSATGAFADVAVGTIDWDSGPEGSWTGHYDRVVIEDAVGVQTWMNVIFTNSPDNPGPYRWDIVKVPATNLFTGTWTTNNWFQMDFWASNIAPLALQMRWKSSTNSSIWGAAMQIPDVDTWTSIGASLLDWTDWQYPGASEEQYLADLQTIDWVGVYIFRNTGAEQLYGIDNFQLWIPEPGQLIMIAAVFLVTGIDRRRKRRAVG